MLRTRALSFLLIPVLLAASAAAQKHPIAVKVVVIAMFESGADTGDTPGELQYWVERDHLDRIYPLPAAYHAVRMNDRGEMAVLTGAGTAHAAATIMAVGLDPRFDFSHAYWIVAGIAGGCPDQVSLGSAAWARWVVDGDLGYEIDAREIPADWSTGMLPLDKSRPFEPPADPIPGRSTRSTRVLRSGLSISRGRRRSTTPKNCRRAAADSTVQRPIARPSSPWATKFLPQPSGTASCWMRGQRNGCLTSPVAKVCLPPRPWRTPVRCNRSPSSRAPAA